QIVVCIFGDGAVNRGPFLEGLNWARIFNLSVLFVCEDNGFSATTRTNTMTGGAGAGARAESIGVPATGVDGNDLPEVDAAARDAIGKIRAGGGPMLLHARTYRISGHTAVDPAAYRPASEVEEQRANCPIARLESMLGLAGVTAAELAALQTGARQEMNRITALAQATDWPDAALAYADVQDIGDPAQRAF
ncbi:MAG: thiamine pyrophosphate-dependent dehydrogenase E1 component subunit alpha, partial [Rhodobacteraceae bacterium]|nr:thiamine pyrophosphate-dependent dehydrogenase E1 component subunit alpha [Paracoccaceae bacterium]